MATQNGGGMQHSGKPNWAFIWHKKLVKFHGAEGNASSQFRQSDVIEFLVDRKKKGTPTWKRLKIAEALWDYQKLFIGMAVSDWTRSWRNCVTRQVRSVRLSYRAPK